MTKDPLHPEADNGDTEAQGTTPPPDFWGPRQFNPAEAAILTGTDKQTLLRMLREGGLNGRLLDGMDGLWLIPLESVKSLLDSVHINN